MGGQRDRCLSAACRDFFRKVALGSRATARSRFCCSVIWREGIRSDPAAARLPISSTLYGPCQGETGSEDRLPSNPTLLPLEVMQAPGRPGVLSAVELGAGPAASRGFVCVSPGTPDPPRLQMRRGNLGCSLPPHTHPLSLSISPACSYVLYGAQVLNLQPPIPTPQRRRDQSPSLSKGPDACGGWPFFQDLERSAEDPGAPELHSTQWFRFHMPGIMGSTNYLHDGQS